MKTTEEKYAAEQLLDEVTRQPNEGSDFDLHDW